MKEIFLAVLAVIGLVNLFRKKEDKWLWVGYGPDPFKKRE